MGLVRSGLVRLGLLGASGCITLAPCGYRVLGSLEVEADGDPVVLGGQKERLLLALLLTRPRSWTRRRPSGSSFRRRSTSCPGASATSRQPGLGNHPEPAVGQLKAQDREPRIIGLKLERLAPL
jgi:hypothetical protein